MGTTRFDRPSIQKRRGGNDGAGRILVVLLCSLGIAALGGNEGESPPSSGTVGGFRIPGGFRIERVAGEGFVDDIRAMTFDEAGRCVVTGPGYIKTLVDHDGNGVADEFKLFAVSAGGGSGMMFADANLYFVGDDGLWRFADLDADGIADGPPARVLTLDTGERGAHGIRQGPDGALYMICGDETGLKPDSDDSFTPGDSWNHRGELSGVIRIDLIRNTITRVALCPGNPIDLSFNWLGDVFGCAAGDEWGSTMPWNQTIRLCMGTAVGHRQSRSAANGGDPAGIAGIPEMPDTLVEMGRGLPTGIEYYRHRQFPVRYHHALFVLDWEFGRVWSFQLIRRGAGYQVRRELFLESIGAKGFTPTDVAVGPDGCLFISVGGRNTPGCVYRVQYVGSNDSTGADPGSGAGTVADVLNAPQPLSAWSRARWKPLARNIGRARLVAAAADETLTRAERARAVEIVTELFGGIPERSVKGMIQVAEPEIRARVAWSLGCRPPGAIMPDLFVLALDSDAIVRRCALEAMIRLRDEIDGAPHVAVMLEANFEHADPRVRVAAARLASLLPDETWSMLNTDDPWRNGRLTTALAAMWRKSDGGLCRDTVETALSTIRPGAPPDAVREAVNLVMRGLGVPAAGDRTPELHRGFAPSPESHGQSVLLRRIADAVNPLFPSGAPRLDGALGRVFAVTAAPDESLPERVAEMISKTSDPADDLHFLTVLSRLPAPRSVEATRSAADAWIACTSKLPVNRSGAAGTFHSRLGDLKNALIAMDPALGDSLIRPPTAGSRTESGSGQERDVGTRMKKDRDIGGRSGTEAHPRARFSTATFGITKMFVDEFEFGSWVGEGLPTESPENVVGSLVNGEILFHQHGCYVCHQGPAAMGPDLKKIDGHRSPRKLLESILNPSRRVSPEFRADAIATVDGTRHVGRIVFESIDRILLRTGARSLARIRVDEIVSREPSSKSVMPDDLFAKLSVSDLADLTVYLRQLK